jgi:hypothetical protein
MINEDRPKTIMKILETALVSNAATHKVNEQIREANYHTI